MAHSGVTRRLAAIVAADIVGYSRLMSEDEAGTLARLKSLNEELLEPKVREYGGRLVKTTGDGALLEFPSAVDAVLCSVTIQRELAEREANLPEAQRIQYRVGVNLGDILIEGDDIFGDGVNVAARLEGLAEPGGIRISDAVFKNVKGKLDLGFADLGPQKVKNIAEPVPTYSVLLDPKDVGKVIEASPRITQRMPILAASLAAILVVIMLGWFSWEHYSTENVVIPEEPRLLVLPFTASHGGAALYADGLTENLFASFGLLKGMTVVPRDEAIRYKGMEPNPNKLSEDHRFDFILDGKVDLQGESLEISARLRTSSGKVVKSETVEGAPVDAFALFAELKTKTTASLQVPLNEKERTLITNVPTRSMKAYLIFEEGRRSENSGDFNGHRIAYERYHQAFLVDPDYIEAMVRYAWINHYV